MEQALDVTPYQGQSAIVNMEDFAMSVDGLLKQVQLIQNVMKKVMKENEHYGEIPGTNKPTLLKPGAEKLCLTFRLDPAYEIIREVREKEFIAYTIKCNLTHIPTGQSIASGIGSCNSRETKYRYRSENTGNPVPKEYWDNRDSSILGGSQYKPRKKDGRWFIFEQVENDNPWDLDNTIIKMACKRALVAATLNATAASDIFTQDLEDLPREMMGDNGTGQSKKTEEKKKKQPEPTPKQTLFGMMEKKGLNKDQCKAFAEFGGTSSTKEIKEFIKGFDAQYEAWQASLEKTEDKDDTFEKNIECPMSPDGEKVSKADCQECDIVNCEHYPK